jgi:predicted dehydrogenase
VAGASLAALSLAPAVHAAGGDTLKVGLIGCGGRGTGAASQALRADSNVKLYAMGDLFADQVQSSLKVLQGDGEIARKIDVTPERCFDGFENYKRVTDLCDVVLLTTPPHFRPAQLEYAVEKNRHLFVEKPVAVDAPGIRRVFQACAEAKKKNLSLVSGLCWRYHFGKRETFKRVFDGAVGDIIALHCSYNTGKLWSKKRKAGMSDAEWQIRNWLYFTWLSGDHIVEQAIHSLDKMAWAMKDQPPVRASAVGGRQVRTSPEFGHIFDHFGVVYEYANGVKMFHFCRQQEGCDGDVSDHILGTKGICEVMKHRITGANPWSYDPPEGSADDMYQTEHNELFASIRRGKPINNGDYMTKSSMLAILGRMAAYTGKTIKWEDALKSNVDLTPKEFAQGYHLGELPMPKVAMPGRTTVRDTLW